MKKSRVVFSRHMRNRRFKKTEEQILKAYSKNSNVSIVKMAKEADVGRSTMYSHHHAVKEIVPDYRKYMVAEYSLSVFNRKASLKRLYLDMLLFVARNKRFFKLFLKFNDTETLRYILKRLRPSIEKFARLPKNSDKIFTIYTGEVIEIIGSWGKHGFPDQDIERVLSDIMFLTATCRDRLMPINY